MTHNPARIAGAFTRFISRQLSSARFAFLWRHNRTRHIPEPVPGPVDFGRIQRVLVVRLDEIGDVVLTTPFLKELKRSLPQASISLVVKTTLRNLFECCPYVDEVLTFESSTSLYWAPLQNCVRARRFAEEICLARNFDLAILPRWDTDWCHASFIPYFSRIPYRIGFSESVNSEKQKLNRGYDRLLTHAVVDTIPRHEVERNLGLLSSLGVIVASDKVDLSISREDDAFAAQLWKDWKVSGEEPVIAFGLGARHQRKVWPLENFVKLGRLIQGQVQCRILLCGDRSETMLGKNLKEQLGDSVIDITGQTTLRQTVALFKRCHLFIGTDSGTKHLAAGAGLPTIEISWSDAEALTIPNSTVNRFRPWQVPYRILSPDRLIPPCSRECSSNVTHCIRGVRAELVAESALQALHERAGLT